MAANANGARAENLVALAEKEEETRETGFTSCIE
jgi:hypothetical protein